jgi:hypothetical protein
MTTTFRVAFVLFVSVSFANDCLAQRGIPVRPVPVRPGPFRPVPVPHPTPIHPSSPTSGGGGGGGDSESSVDPITVIVGVVVCVGVGVGLWLGVRAWNNRTVAHLRIKSTPPGEAPEEIRRAWVGVELPLRSCETGTTCISSVGVLSHQYPESAMGYIVDGPSAVAALESQAPAAAEWWRQNAPHVVAPGYRLFFPVEVCERVG